ncbi:MAG: hypothetical protein M3Q12_13860 [Pseudomonadota bacterium]|uniref:hypothetical protein n=1 Tax=Polaromonas sp. TaxID=1869339 RepID=UPI001841564C|nr:hypothetical protein [Polaromonas sp.]MBA3592701.1 hypothetical protein [Polaromonas sp.]MDQ3273230.1 hypothetical protein [Pseudomonadota bacterium]
MSATAQAASDPTEGLHDFDFLFGHWRVHNQRLRQRLQRCTDWEEFDATQYCQPLLGGMGNTDEMLHDAGPVGMSLRFLDLQTRQWNIYWVSPEDGLLQPPVTGEFFNGTGVFEGVDTHEGQPVRVRYTWSGTHTATPRWKQAFSTDDGKTWETNWVMTFTRSDAAPPTQQALPSANHDFDFFFGQWKVQNRRLLPTPQNGNEWESFDGLQICEPLLGGLANYDELRDGAGVPLGLSVHLFDVAAQRWKAYWVSARDGLLQPALTGGFSDSQGVLEGNDQIDGRPVRLRHTWSRLNTAQPRWEQAISADEGLTWQPNWTMNYTRLES